MQSLETEARRLDKPEPPGIAGKGLRYKHIMLPMIGLLAILGALGLIQFFKLLLDDTQTIWSVLQLGLLLLGIVLSVHVLKVIRKSLLEPLAQVRHWVTEVRSGEFSARMPALANGEFSDLGRDINRLANVIQTLSQDLEAEAKAQTVILERKTQSLELLYQLTASINESYDLDELLTQYMHSLRELIHAHAGIVFLVEKSETRMVSVFGVENRIEDGLPEVSVRQIRQGILRGEHIMEMEAPSSPEMSTSEKILVVPLQYQETIVGFYYLFARTDLLPLSRETDNILVNVGRHLGVAIEQSRLNVDADRLVLVEERTRLANELHDSLAQTIASLRFQVRVLDETLHQGVESAVWRELEKIENSVDQANEEIRELMAKFRAPIVGRDLVVSIQKLINKFESETHTKVFFQNEWEDDDLPPDARTELVRIVQEALTNIRKHANANNVRVLIRHVDGHYNLLIEDDGIGVSQTSGNDSKPGEHIGLSIMRERADSLEAEFQVDSDLGEGTRISVRSRSSNLKDAYHLVG